LLPYCLASHRGCLHEAVFSPGTPDAMIIVAIEAALSPPRPGRPEPDHVATSLACGSLPWLRIEFCTTKMRHSDLTIQVMRCTT
jgi:hypothetical protein